MKAKKKKITLVFLAFSFINTEKNGKLNRWIPYLFQYIPLGKNKKKIYDIVFVNQIRGDYKCKAQLLLKEENQTFSFQNSTKATYESQVL